jgi:23S rRNA (uracil1939-C5)-methyltransferase
MRSCEVVPPAVSSLLVPLRELIGSLSIPDRVPQIELAIGDDTTVLVFRVLVPPSDADRERLRVFGRGHGVHVYLQPKGPDTAVPLDGAPVALGYRLPEFGLRIGFLPTDFTQVNHAVNAVLVRRALSLLDPQPGERIGDLFCGLGNFTLAIARRGARVLGVEGSAGLLARAADNARVNGLADRVEFRAADLFKVSAETLAGWGPFDRLLVDPPRDGAMTVVKNLAANAPRRIVYVSCNPSTLARDAEVLVHAQGYVLSAAGVINMFPHTAHVESMAVFDRPE